MGRLISVVMAMVLLSVTLLSSSIKLIEPADAIRLVGDKRVVFVSGERNETYQDAHIIGSVSMPVSDFYRIDKAESVQCMPLYKCPVEAQEYIQRKGIENDQMIIIYDNFPDPGAAAVYSFFETIGHANLKVLNGGLGSIKALDPNQLVFDELQAERYEIIRQAEAAKQAGDIDNEEDLESQAESIKAKIDFLESQLLISSKAERRKASDYQLDIEKFNVDYIAEKKEVENAVSDILKDGNKSNFLVVDMRCLDLKTAEDDTENAAGESRSSGLKYIDWKDIADFEKKKSFKSSEEMQKIFDSAGITHDKTIYVYCQNDTALGLYIVSALRFLDYKHVKIVIDNLTTGEIIQN
jgi:thiosulfate/3-mercaptopyruvate sulfurtransferase